MYPASTSHTLVLPLRTNGRNHFSLEPCPLPSSLSGRLSEDEWATLLGRANRSLATHRSFGLSSLLLPFLAIDAASVALLYALTPRSLLAPLTVELPELLLPLLLELVLVLSAFPIVSALVNRRVRAVQAKAKEVFDEASRKYAARGVHFALKLGVHSAGAATNMWMEAQVYPLFRVPTPVPVLAPYPVLMPAPPATPLRSTTGSSSMSGSEAGLAGGVPLSRSPCSVPVASADSSERTDTVRCASSGEPVDASGASAPAASAHPSLLAQELTAAVAAGTLTPQQQEYLRVLQENQLLRQYLAQMQVLVQLQVKHGSAQAAQQAVQPRASGQSA
mmetsp:Transcript_5193/g.15885  ORF Transcript_5193/g.15885 Transcript_5193/m.15885 type:complete len:334 (-) Transcript_5193:387-1388(-)